MAFCTCHEPVHECEHLVHLLHGIPHAILVKIKWKMLGIKLVWVKWKAVIVACPVVMVLKVIIVTTRKQSA